MALPEWAHSKAALLARDRIEGWVALSLEQDWLCLMCSWVYYHHPLGYVHPHCWLLLVALSFSHVFKPVNNFTSPSCLCNRKGKYSKTKKYYDLCVNQNACYTMIYNELNNLTIQKS